jgi:transposase-like protein
MPRLNAAKYSELEAFWRSHLDGWRRSDLNQREYCEAHGLPLKRFESWRAKYRHEDRRYPRKVLYRRNGDLGHMASHMPKENPAPVARYIPSARSGGSRRNFGEADKRRIVEEAGCPGASISGVARKYGIGPRLLFRWKQELTMAAPTIVPVVVSDAAERPAEDLSALLSASMSAPVIVERSTPAIEVELIGGRRVRFGRDVDPETVHRLVTLLEAGVS